jgi:hypothetical protein
VKLVKGGQLLRRKSLISRPERRQRGLQPFGQAGRLIVVAHAIKNIVHCSIPPRLRILAADIRALPASDYQR